jgi:hypothetical protein
MPPIFADAFLGFLLNICVHLLNLRLKNLLFNSSSTHRRLAEQTINAPPG